MSGTQGHCPGHGADITANTAAAGKLGGVTAGVADQATVHGLAVTDHLAAGANIAGTGIGCDHATLGVPGLAADTAVAAKLGGVTVAAADQATVHGLAVADSLALGAQIAGTGIGCDHGVLSTPELAAHIAAGVTTAGGLGGCGDSLVASGGVHATLPGLDLGLDAAAQLGTGSLAVAAQADLAHDGNALCLI
jgi:hypothetical protein